MSGLDICRPGSWLRLCCGLDAEENLRMIVLTVHSYNGVPSQGGTSASFDEMGGTIGRADGNTLVLPDPERTISRVHARVLFRAGGYAIADNGSNPISVNGSPVGAGRECPLRPGDRVEIGGYVLAASEAAPSASDDPFADLFGDAAQGLAAAPAATRKAAAAPSLPPSPPAPAPARTAEPMRTAAWPAPPSPPTPRPPAPAASSPAGIIPDDWDPFAPEPAAMASPPALPASIDVPIATLPGLEGGVPAGGGESIDDLFGLGGALAAPGSAAPDPLGASAAAMAAQPNTASSADPLQSLLEEHTTPLATIADHASELNTPMPLPPAALGAPRVPAPQPRGAVFSWDDPPREGKVVTLPTGAAPPARPPAPPAAMSPRMARPAAAAAATSAAASADADALLQAFLQGLGSPNLRLAALTPEKMQLVGELLREATRGAVELLVARAALKRELRAEMTMIVAKENNPLKFSPTVDVALAHLLGERTPGFMAPGAALKDAFDDLRAHQLGVMAGMRAALEGVLGRFDPAELEGKLAKGSKLSSLIPATRKARLWELFQELFSQLQREAQDDFDELFGRAFLRAYEEQLDRLARERR
jgi:type VI secretion system FHA domain protein